MLRARGDVPVLRALVFLTLLLAACGGQKVLVAAPPQKLPDLSPQRIAEYQADWNEKDCALIVGSAIFPDQATADSQAALYSHSRPGVLPGSIAVVSRPNPAGILSVVAFVACQSPPPSLKDK